MSRFKNNNTDAEVPEAPELENIFQAFCTTSALNYCVVCLRTDAERRLVKCRAFKKFATAMKIDNKWQNHLICYMCEHQAIHALKFFKAATFASAINKIFEEALKLKKRSRRQFNTTNFVKTLKKLKLLNIEWNLPSEWEAELMAIRGSSQFSETEPLVIDNRGVKLTQKSVQLPNEVYVIPDDPPDLFGQVTATATRSCGTTEFPIRDKRPAGRTIRDPGQNRTNNSEETGWRPGSDVQQDTIALIANDSLVLSSSETKVSETLVILDEEEDRDPLQIRIEKVKSEAEPTELDCPQSTPESLSDLLTQPNYPQLSVVPQSVLNVPKLVPIERLLKNTTGPSSCETLLLPGDNNFILHPIVFNSGLLTVPSLAANLLNGQLVYQPTQQSTPIPNMDNQMLKVLIENAPREISLPTNDAYCQTNIPSRVQKATNNDIMAVTKEDPKSTKRDCGFTIEKLTPSKKNKRLPVIESVTSEADKCERIDWEDQIPMDVISFMDAVDPKRPNLPDPSLTPSFTLSGVTPETQATQTPVGSVFIDLS